MPSGCLPQREDDTITLGHSLGRKAQARMPQGRIVVTDYLLGNEESHRPVSRLE